MVRSAREVIVRVLITGGLGFFGSRAAAAFTDAEVFALDRPEGDRARLEALAPRARFVPCDMFDAEALGRCLADVRPDVCIHLAWYAVPGKYLDAPENLDHLVAAVGLARALAKSGCARLVTAGTCFEYDTTYGRLAESTPAAPRTLYAATKLSMFQSLAHACPALGVSHAHARFFYQYGPWEAPKRLVSSLMESFLAGTPAPATAGEQVRDFLHIEDVAQAIRVLGTSDATGLVNIGSGVPVTVADVARAVEHACGAEGLLQLGALPSRPGDPPFVCADASRLRSLGWAPRYGLDEGLADTVAWYRARAR